MPDRADAHIHLFEHGYQGASFAARPGVTLDEPTCFESLMRSHDVAAALVVGYAGTPWARDNNAFVTRVAAVHDWVFPTVYLDPQALTIETLSRHAAERFVGISLYLFDRASTDALGEVDDAVWAWLVDRRWLVSVNARGATWAAWLPILKRFPTLRVLVSHLGLPTAAAQPPSPSEAEHTLADVLSLAAFPGPRVKLSGFYALTLPAHDYPHRAAWPYVQALTHRFGVERLLWASDFSPCLDSITYPQTYTLFTHMPWFTETDRQAIEGGNLFPLLHAARGIA